MGMTTYINLAFAVRPTPTNMMITRRITGRKPSRKALSEMIDYRDKVLELYKEKRAEMREIEVVMKSYICLEPLQCYYTEIGSGCQVF